MKEGERSKEILLPLARLVLTAGVVGLSLAAFVAVFVGLDSVPILMMAGFLLAYVAFSYIRRRPRA
jgi:hypothetical protein